MTQAQVSASSRLHSLSLFWRLSHKRSFIGFLAFANFFSDDVSDDMSTYYPSMYNDMRDQVIASTAAPRSKLRILLVLVCSSLPPLPPSTIVLSSDPRLSRV